VLDELAESGESIETFCRRLGVRRSTLYWWKWKLASSPRRSEQGAAIRLLPVTVSTGTGGSPPARPIVIELANLRLHVEAGTDVAYLGALIDRLRP